MCFVHVDDNVFIVEQLIYVQLSTHNAQTILRVDPS